MNKDAVGTCLCGKCGAEIEYPAEMAGSGAQCPQCTAPLDLPPLAVEPVPRALDVKSLLSQFTGSVGRTRTSWPYLTGLLVVAVVMILLPLLYVAMIGAVIWGVYAYATRCLWLLRSFHGGARAYVWRIVAYVGPLFVGTALVLFMVKPLLARQARRPEPVFLSPSREPILFAFIYRICELLGAPNPTRVAVDCDLNASAGFQRSALGLWGRDLVLTIGLPLVAGLNTRQLAGVVAHEFGHFTQGTAMRLSSIIRRVNVWFARVIYERDGWDRAIDEWAANEEDWRVKLVILCTSGAIWVSRTLLKPLMYAGHAISCFMMRQMEYDADLHEMQLVGSGTFESTIFRSRLLAAATNKAYADLKRLWLTQRGMPDDLPGYLVLQESEMPAAVRERILSMAGLARTGAFDTHPSDADRIRGARQAGVRGVFHLERPATDLFADFKVLARKVTASHYVTDLGLRLNSVQLKPVE